MVCLDHLVFHIIISDFHCFNDFDFVVHDWYIHFVLCKFFRLFQPSWSYIINDVVCTTRFNHLIQHIILVFQITVWDFDLDIVTYNFFDNFFSFDHFILWHDFFDHSMYVVNHFKVNDYLLINFWSYEMFYIIDFDLVVDDFHVWSLDNDIDVVTQDLNFNYDVQNLLFTIFVNVRLSL